jgi:hypothetical protein
MKTIYILLTLYILPFLGFSQIEKTPTKMETFLAKSGGMIKFEDYPMAGIHTSYTVAESRVRKVTVRGDTEFFYQIEKETKYDKVVASIAYEDLKEMRQALKALKSEAETDTKGNRTSHYLENKFVTDDGFKIGYYISKKYLQWFIVLDKYSSDNSLFLKEIDFVDASLKVAIDKIEELMKL